ncbi:MAG: hypothetical protein HN368_17965 [Spirochaetales bacterium]|jgi:hypothetical protein|nr:hypothetical protein [Spirochaetales bacterium]
MGKKTVGYTRLEIDALPNDRPVVYQIQTQTGTKNYIGFAQKGRVTEQIKSHLGDIPGTKVTISQHKSLADAKQSAGEAVKKNFPKYNIKKKK